MTYKYHYINTGGVLNHGAYMIFCLKSATDITFYTSERWYWQYTQI
jgi:hypothetical protein